ncbi:MAG: DUF2971 domain-containing protein [Alphaproteobacteria bacterium]|nr:DUF2971 domain-containing protein [Alphaproteobacteria bacterium]
MSAKYAKTFIESGLLKVSRINDLNDPFEFLPADISNEKHKRALTRWKEERNKDRGLICFSEEWNNLLLWSHYADKHRGIALGFDVAEQDVFRVSYASKRLEIPFCCKTKKIVGGEEVLKDLLSTKSVDWKYEAEHRLFCRLSECTQKCTESGSLYFEKFSSSLVLREVLVGMNCPDSPEEIGDLLVAQRETVAVKKIKPSDCNFSLNITSGD